MNLRYELDTLGAEKERNDNKLRSLKQKRAVSNETLKEMKSKMELNSTMILNMSNDLTLQQQYSNKMNA